MGRSLIRSTALALYGAIPHACFKRSTRSRGVDFTPLAQHYSDASGAIGSPLAARLFKVPNVTSVFLGPDFVSINKDESTGWLVCAPATRSGGRSGT